MSQTRPLTPQKEEQEIGAEVFTSVRFLQFLDMLTELPPFERHKALERFSAEDFKARERIPVPDASQLG